PFHDSCGRPPATCLFDHGTPRPLHSFPTRRSSDLSQPEMRAAMAQAEAIMRSRRHLRPREPNDFALETADEVLDFQREIVRLARDRKSTRLNSSHQIISYAVFCLKKKKQQRQSQPP